MELTWGMCSMRKSMSDIALTQLHFGSKKSEEYDI